MMPLRDRVWGGHRDMSVICGDDPFRQVVRMRPAEASASAVFLTRLGLMGLRAPYAVTIWGSGRPQRSDPLVFAAPHSIFR